MCMLSVTYNTHTHTQADYIEITSRYPVEYPRSFVLGGKKIFRSGEGKGIRGGGWGGGGGGGGGGWG